jgi:ABC-type transport system involved in multi-copper enzyme maturation permease subunit
MLDFLRTIEVEYLKIKRSTIPRATFIAFALAPIMGGVFILIVQSPEALSKSGGLALKMQAMNFAANWDSYFMILSQSVAVGGILVFGFVISWLFGREYSDRTTKDLLALPTSRTQILNAKFIVYIIWCFALVISNLLIAFIVGSCLQIDVPQKNTLNTILSGYFLTTLFTIVLGLPIAFFALWGKGYLSPLSFVALTLVFAQIIAATGFGNYFPWSVPALYSGASGEYKLLLNQWSYISLFITGIAGYFLTIRYWKYSDQVT